MSAPASGSSTPPGFNPGQSPNYSFTRPRAPSPYLRSLLVYIDAVNARDFGSLATVFDDALEHRILPKSLARPVLTKKLYIDYWRSVMAMFSQFETRIHEVIEAGDKITLHGSTEGVSVSGTRYSNEYMMLLHFAPLTQEEIENGQLPRIRYLKEFVDSAYSVQFFKEESERQKEKQKKGKDRALSLGGIPASAPTGSGLARGRFVRS